MGLDMQPLTSYFPVILRGVAAGLVVSPLAILAARRFGLMDVPGSRNHKRHTQPTPLAGGLALAASLMLNALWEGWLVEPMLRAGLGGAAVILCLGLLDDRIDLRAWQKLLGQCLAAALLIAGGVQVRLLGEPIGLLLTFLWIVGMTNAFNFVDSMDGLAIGLAGIASAFFMLATIDAGQPHLAGLSAGVLGATVGLYFFNLRPARLFLGDAGSELLGFMLATIGVAYLPRDFAQAASWYVPILVLGVPLFDTVLVVFSRARRGRKVYRPGSDHTYHRLVRLNLDPPRAVFLMQLGGVILGIVAFIGLEAGPILGNLLAVGIATAGVVLVLFFERRALPEG